MQEALQRVQPTARAPRQRILGRPIPAEGENGLFTQTWFPICLRAHPSAEFIT